MTTKRTATVTDPDGNVLNLGGTGEQFVFASFYRVEGRGYMVKVHRSENVARKGQWDSPAMRKLYPYAGYARIDHN